MRPFAYAAPRSVAEALPLLGAGARPLAGGTDLLGLMKAEVEAPQRLVSLGRIAGLSRAIEESSGGLVLGALATLADIERHPAIAARYPALAQAAGLAASAQLRNVATLGGNLLQRPRCWYYRSAHFHCWLKGGESCHAREGENRLHALFGDAPCCAVHPSDLAPVLLALDAELAVRAPEGERRVRAADFFALPEAARRSETRLGENELIVSVRLPAAAARSAYLKAMDRASFAFALASAAVALRMEDGSVARAAIVLGGVAPVPWRARAAEALLRGARPEPALLERAAEAALEGARPLAQNGYKVPLARALVLRALQAAAEAA
jgi:xanthine dehydrogenase YagS FAD-binding subunit